MGRKEFLYIYGKNNIHNWGIVLESTDEEKVQKFIRLLLPNGTKDSACIAKKFHPFWQSGSNNLKSGYQFIEFFYNFDTKEAQAELIHLIQKVSDELGIEWSIDRPKEAVV